jgi:hypothetical protein
VENKYKYSLEETEKLYEFFEKSVMSWPEQSANLIESCKHCQVWFIKDLIVKIVYEKNLFSQAVSKQKQDWKKILFAEESCREIRQIFFQHGIILDILLEPNPKILKIFFQKYPQYKRPPA